jgi:hypothetical protein
MTREQPLGVGADPAHQGQGLAVGTEQDVLAVVQPATVEFDTAGAAAEDATGFKDVVATPLPVSSTAAASPAQPPPMTATRMGFSL